jgi:hypothetical protein
VERKKGQWLKGNVQHEGSKGKIQEHLQGSSRLTTENALQSIGITKNESSKSQRITKKSP